MLDSWNNENNQEEKWDNDDRFETSFIQFILKTCAKYINSAEHLHKFLILLKDDIGTSVRQWCDTFVVMMKTKLSQEFENDDIKRDIIWIYIIDLYLTCMNKKINIVRYNLLLVILLLNLTLHMRNQAVCNIKHVIYHKNC